MNTQSSAMPGSPLASQAAAPVAISATQRMYWLVRRELWESRSLYIAPLAVAALILMGFLISTFHLAHKMRVAMALSPMQQLEAIRQPYNFAELALMATFLIVAVFYCLDALHGERRDRGILFWKSLPVSDLETVLAKASIPILVLPLFTFAVTVVTQCIMLLWSTVVLMGSGGSASTLWSSVPLLQMSLGLLDHLFAFHGLWYAPIYCWLLLVSAWARRAPFLWATLPLLAIGVVEKIAFNTSHLGAMLEYRISGATEGAAFRSQSASMDPLTHFVPGQFLFSPGMWVGLGIAAIFLAAAIRLRRYRQPI
jgi:ABC-2 type transport system permease protein